MLRAFLIWLLVLALPAQGALAASMAFCGPNHHDRAAAAAMAQHADSAHQPKASATHRHDTAAHAHAAVIAADEDSVPDKFASTDVQKCSVCASCCSAAAIYDAVPKLPVLEPGAADFAALVLAIEPFAADGPDRPPRHIPA